jgi:hypothetical protein
MLSEISYRDYKKWCAFQMIDPFTEIRGDMRSAQLLYYLMNMLARKRFDPLIPIDKFLLVFGEENKPVKKSDEEMKSKMYLFLYSQGMNPKKEQ